MAAAVLAAAGACVMTLAPAALAREARQAQQPGQPASVVIDSVSPQFARPGGTVTVTGTVTNESGSVLSGLSIQLRSSASPLGYRGELTSYADGTLAADAPVGSPELVSSSLADHATARWRISLPVSAIGMTQFGVYPLAAQAADLFGTPVGTDRTFLPFWPGAAASGVTQRLKIAWLWPLISAPQQGVCPALTSDSLARSVAGGGRLDTLLTTGAAYSARAGLTWAVDPALLNSVNTMTSSYEVGGSPGCTGGTMRHASAAAAQWLSTLRTATARQQMFVTPYDDVDVAALTHEGLDSDLTSAFNQGRLVASTLLGRSFGSPAAGGTAGQTGLQSASDAIAWPADGLADSSVLGDLAVNGIGTVVLSSSEMPPAATNGYTPDSAMTSTPTPAGTTMKVLLADNTITGILGSATATPGSSFAVSQRFLAETAMIVAEAPSLPRSVVIAPPREWDPSASLAGQLLSETADTPWLAPTTLAGLAGSPGAANQVARQQPPDVQVSPQELSRHYLNQVSALDATMRLYKSILHHPVPEYLSELNAGVAATESSAWRGSQAARQQGMNMLNQVAGYISAQNHKVQIIHSSAGVTLAGSSGQIPVSIANGLPQSIQVRLQATEPADSRLTVTGDQGPITIGAGQTDTTRLSVHSGAVGDTTIQLRLLNKDGMALPDAPVSLSVRSAQFGTALLVIIFAALGVLVLTSIARAIRRGLRDGQPASDQRGNDRQPASDQRGNDRQPASGQRGNEEERPAGMPARADGAATVERGNDATDPRDPPEAPDDFAEARGWARYT
jgi:hypothetical protein